jgi:hypothetical protein
MLGDPYDGNTAEYFGNGAIQVHCSVVMHHGVSFKCGFDWIDIDCVPSLKIWSIRKANSLPPFAAEAPCCSWQKSRAKGSESRGSQLDAIAQRKQVFGGLGHYRFFNERKRGAMLKAP